MLRNVKQFQPDDLLGVAIKKNSSGDIHSGIVFDAGSGSKFIHLAGEKVISEAPSEKYRWLKAGIDESTKKVAAGMCALIEARSPEVPYAFDRAGWTFDDAGDVVSGAPGKGMTCATFILAVFDAIRFPLLKEHQWPRGADKGEKLSIFSMIFGGDRIESDHASKAMNDDDTPRIRPSEVAASTTETAFPVAYPLAKKRGAALEKKLDKL